jgi:truncated hemoglobin YjbI
LNQLKTKFQLKEESLYSRFGGEAAINALVEGMYQKIFNDPDL